MAPRSPNVTEIQDDEHGRVEREGGVTFIKQPGAGGRPTIYQPRFVTMARKIAELGGTNADIADGLGVNLASVNLWKNIHPKFNEALKVGKAATDNRVERSLLERACGYTWESEKVFCDKDGHVTRVQIREHVPPDTTAQIFWLKNRRPDEWRANNGQIDPDTPFEVIVRGGLTQKPKAVEKS